MVNMFEMGTRVMVGMLIRELEGRMIKREMTVSMMVLVGREMVEMMRWKVIVSEISKVKIRVMMGMLIR